ncbi:MAG TPA: nitroreductase family protein [bacterium]|mgnify:CR=1 FL=1|nr:nitroreductase family protein [bacterium]
METMQAIKTRRTIRRFLQKPIPFEHMKECVNAGRLAPSGGNIQPWEFLVIDDITLLEPVFSTLSWAVYLGPVGTPKEGEKPVAYIVVFVREINQSTTVLTDIGAAIENILIAAADKGIGSCWIGSIQKDKLASILNLPKNCLIQYVIALGYPAEQAVIEEGCEDEDVKYWRDEKGIHHVPKRKIENIVHHNIIKNT